MARLQDHARRCHWDLVVGLTELPLHDREGRHLLVQADPEQRTAVLSLPALGARVPEADEDELLLPDSDPAGDAP